MVGGRQRAYFHARLFRGAHVFARRGVPRGGQYAKKGDAPYRDAPRRIYEQPRQRQGAPYRQRIERGDGNISCAPTPRHGGRVRNACGNDRSFVCVRLAAWTFEPYPDRPRLYHHVQNDGEGYGAENERVSERARKHEQRGGGICARRTRRQDIRADCVFLQAFQRFHRQLPHMGGRLHQKPYVADGRIHDRHQLRVRAAHHRGALLYCGRCGRNLPSEPHLLYHFYAHHLGHADEGHVHERKQYDRFRRLAAYRRYLGDQTAARTVRAAKAEGQFRCV